MYFIVEFTAAVFYLYCQDIMKSFLEIKFFTASYKIQGYSCVPVRIEDERVTAILGGYSLSLKSVAGVFYSISPNHTELMNNDDCVFIHS